MQTRSPTPVWSCFAPPLPPSPSEPHHVLWHPTEKACWLLVPGMGSLWRVELDGTAALIASNCLPEIFNARYVWSTAFYFDTARQTPMFLAGTYVDNIENGVLLCAFNGKTFEPVALKNGIRAASSDAFVFDPERAVLLHIAGQRDMDSKNDAIRAKQGGMIVRELGPENDWRDVDAQLPETGQYEAYAGYEPRRKLVVVIDSDSGESYGFNGKSWRRLGSLLTYPWKPNTLFASASTGNLLFLQRQRSSDDYTAILSELSDEGWLRRDIGALESFGGALVHPVQKETLVFGPWFGPGTVQSTWGRYDGARIVPVGKAWPMFSGASKSGRVSFWGGRDAGHGNYAAAIRRPYSAKIVAVLEGEQFRYFPPSPPVIAMASDGKSHFGIGFWGEVFRGDEGGWETIAKAPSDFTERNSCLLGIDKAGRLLLVGGDPTQATNRLRDVWRFQEKWEMLATKGSVPLASDSFVAYDEMRQVWVVAGGHVKYEPNPKTFELSEANKWSSFLTAVQSETQLEVPRRFSILAWDPASSQIFAVASKQYGDDPMLYVYRGEGRYEPIAKLEGDGISWAIHSFDADKRALVIASGVSLAILAIGDLLDEAQKAVPPPPLPAKPTKRKQAAREEKEPQKAMPDAVWLKLQEGDRFHFWFAKREGTTLRVESGSKGKQAKIKTTAYKSEEDARKAYEKAVAGKTGDGYEHAPEREACAVVKGKKAYLVKLGAKGEDAFGGCAPGVEGQRWPVCKECECPLTHVMTLKANPERLPLKHHAALAIFVCCNEESAGCCETWDPDEGANAVLLLSEEDLAKKPLRKTPKSLGDKAASPTLRARQIIYRETFEEDPENENPELPPATSKVGGYPGWIQFAATPECSECGKLMTFAAQLGELDDDLNFAGGDSYVFYCPDEHEGRFLWQH